MSKFEVIHGSCADQDVDVIVNAANKYLAAGGGICGVIYSRAGYTELYEATKDITKPISEGDAVITSAFKMTNTKYIIHAVGPDFSLEPTSFDKLFGAYYSSLKLAAENDLHSISFPLISSGIFGGSLEDPAAESTKQCILAYEKFTEENPGYEITLKLCAYTEKEHNSAIKISKYLI